MYIKLAIIIVVSRAQNQLINNKRKRAIYSSSILFENLGYLHISTQILENTHIWNDFNNAHQNHRGINPNLPCCLFYWRSHVSFFCFKQI